MRARSAETDVDGSTDNTGLGVVLLPPPESWRPGAS